MPALLRSHLGVVCPSCDFLNVVGAAKCMSCGSATDSALPLQRTDKHHAHAPEPAVAAPVPPGLRRANTAPPIAAVPSAPARPTFQSSNAPPQVASTAVKFGLSVLAGP